MVTSPKACPTCKGSRRHVELTQDFESLPEFDPSDDRPSIARMVGGVGYVFPLPVCSDCDGYGTVNVPEPPGEYPPPRRISLSKDQSSAIEEILSWFHKSDSPRKSLAGFAGTGKTFIIRELVERLKGISVSVCAPTGKAAAVLKSKGVEASTLHKLIYAPQKFCTRCMKETVPLRGFDGKHRCPTCRTTSIKLRWTRVPIISADLVIVDEASMLTVSMVEDIEKLAKKILYVGDHGQLEPVGEDPRIMREPDIRLERIHRQARQSGIIQLAHHMRTGAHPDRWDGHSFTDARVALVTKLIPRMLSRFDIVLCGYNKTRKSVNTAIRNFRGFSGKLPVPGERLICLQNDSDIGVYNGLLVTVVACKGSCSHPYPILDLMDDSGNEFFDVQVHPDQFEEERKLEYISKGIGLFDFGYCLTVHKAQGSEWNTVAVIEQLARTWDPARWRYTAVTRAAKKLEYWIPSGRL